MNAPDDLNGYRFDGYVIVENAHASWGGNIRKRWCGPWDDRGRAEGILSALLLRYPHKAFYIITWWDGGFQKDVARILVDRDIDGGTLEQLEAA